ncbi:MAG: hypothetical protein ABI977_25810 [Acidobacteriota bacterium]
MFLVRTFVLICCLAVPFLAQGVKVESGYAPVDLKEFANHSAELEGRRVAITAEIISVSADARAMNVFDNDSKTLVGVSLTHLSKSQRQTLVGEPVHRVSVYGRVELKNGRAVIKADQVMPLATNMVAQK